MKKRQLLPGRSRSRPALQIGFEALNAHRMAQKLVAGFELDPGEKHQLSTMPALVQHAVRSCFRSKSRYQPPIFQKRRTVGPMRRGADPVTYWESIDRYLASALLSGDAVAERRRRWKVVHLPSRVAGFGKIALAFARSYSVSISKILENMQQAKTFEDDDQIFDQYERPNKGSKRQSRR